MRILVVCTANVCRSPFGQVVVDDRLRAHGIAADVESGGVRASIGEHACEAMWVDSDFSYPTTRTAHQVTADDLATADFVLAFERDHRSALVTMNPSARARIFTFVEAASLAEAVVAEGQALDHALGRVSSADNLPLRGNVPALPTSIEDRARWFAAEMDANRGLVAIGTIPNATLTVDGESIIDPLFVKENVHPDVANLTVTYADRWASALQTCLSA